MAELPGVVVAGHICLDILPDMNLIPAGQFAQQFQPGRLIEVGAAAFSTGGPVSNTGLALHKLGIPTRLMGKIGADLLGQAVLEVVRSYDAGLAANMLADRQSSTSYSVIISPPGVDRIFLHSPGANNTFCAADVQYDQVAQAALFHFGYPPLMRRMYEQDGAELLSIFRQVKASGVTTSLDMAFPNPTSPGGQADWRAIYRAVLPYVDIFLPSIEELLFTLRPAQYAALQQQAGSSDILNCITPDLLTDLSAELLAMGVRVLVIKLGARGLYLRTAGDLSGMGRAAPADPAAWSGRQMWAPCFQVKVVGTTGSGDATIAGFLGALLRGLSPGQAITSAVAVGACNVEAADALSGIRTWEETQARLAAPWPRHSLALDAPGWHWDAAHALWEGG